MTPAISTPRIRFILFVAIAMTLGAEVFYLIVFGMFLYPAGSLPAKIVWTTTCGIAMGAVIGLAVLLLAESRKSAAQRFWITAAAMTVVGTYCAWLCSRIDAAFNYFGGAENASLFILSGVIPAIVGGALYGWIIQAGTPTEK